MKKSRPAKPTDNTDACSAPGPPLEGVPASSVITVLRDLQAGTLLPSSLSIEDRQRCVEHLTGDGYATAEIAEILKVTERTVLRDRKIIRAANALKADDNFVAETIGGMLKHAEIAVVRLRRIGRDRETSAGVKVEAERAAWEVQRDVIHLLQRLGHLPVATQQIRGELTHHLDGGLTFEALGAELARIEPILSRGNVTTPLLESVAQTKKIMNKLALADQERMSHSPTGTETPDEHA